jgi:hypothetical protein
MREIPLTKGRVAFVSDEDWERVSQYHWFIRGLGYVATTINHKKVYLHRFIMGAKDGQYIDHINGIRTDCRRENMRFCNKSQNSANSKLDAKNTSGYRGVSFCVRDKIWKAQIQVEEKGMRLGSFHNPIDAAKAYDVAALAYFGEFARLNFPEAIYD